MNKQEYLKSIGKILVAENGKQKFYNKEQVEKSHEKITLSDAFDVSEIYFESAMSLYTSLDEYIKVSGATAEKYIQHKSDALHEISNDSILDWDSLTDFDMNMSWLDMGDIIESVGEFLGGILGALD